MSVSCFKGYQLIYFKNKRSGRVKLGQVFWLTFWYITCLPTPFWDVKDFIGYIVLLHILLILYIQSYIHIHVQTIGYSMMTSIYIKFLLFVEKLRRKRCVSYCRMYICSVHTTALPCTIDIALYNSVLYWWLTLTCYVDILSHQWLSINSYLSLSWKRETKSW